MKNNNMRKIYAIALAICLTIIMVIPAAASFQTHDLDGFMYGKEIKYYGTDEITYDILVNRTPDTIIVEKVVGVVLNAETGDGRVLNTEDPVYNYINYGGLGLNDMDIVVTFDIYNPETQYEDDVIQRLDFKVGSVLDFCKMSQPQQPEDEYIKTFSELPEWAKPEMREILDKEYINGGTPYKENPNDINMYMSDIKTIIVSYRMCKEEN